MQKYRIATTIANDGMLMIEGLPFQAGDKVEVVVYRREREGEDRGRYPLRDKPIRYIDPFGSVAENEWDVLQ
jgi:hypothetical protein